MLARNQPLAPQLNASQWRHDRRLQGLSSAEEREAYTLRQRRFDPVSPYQNAGEVQQLRDRSSIRRIPALQAGDAGADPAGSTNLGASSKGKDIGFQVQRCGFESYRSCQYEKWAVKRLD